MNWLDIVLAVILLASVLSSFRKGLSREVISLVSVCLALLLGIWLYGSAAVYLLPYLRLRQTANFAGFAVVFALTATAAGAVHAHSGSRHRGYFHTVRG